MEIGAFFILVIVVVVLAVLGGIVYAIAARRRHEELDPDTERHGERLRPRQTEVENEQNAEYVGSH